MSKKVAENRRGLPEKKVEVKNEKTITFSREIDDESIWFVKIGLDKKSCRKSGLMQLFDKQSKSWTVEVLGCWIDGDGRKYIEF